MCESQACSSNVSLRPSSPPRPSPMPGCLGSCTVQDYASPQACGVLASATITVHTYECPNALAPLPAASVGGIGIQWVQL